MYFDNVFKTPVRQVVRVLPIWLSPMHLTYARLALIPVIAAFLFFGYYAVATVLFLLAVSADALDGELARARNQITALGTLLDPVADKALIGTVALLLIPSFFGWPFLCLLLALETAIAGAAYVRDRRAREHLGASRSGKLKMVAQSLGLVILLVAASTGSKLLAEAALVVLIVAIILAIATLDSYVRYRPRKDAPQ
jgi:CDP-diacylglycerol---glycerol-3-phosphate 3-phosphatidyltransferase